MSVSLRFASISELDKSIQKLADAAGSTVKDVLPAQMRLFAADLALNTRPLGKSASVQKDHQVRIFWRIANTYTSIKTMSRVVSKADKKAGARFNRYIREKNYSKAETILNSVTKGSEIYTIGPFDGGKLHNSQRNLRKPIRKLVCLDFKAAIVYAKSVIKKSGYAKSGFATAARQLGGVRGIPGFVTRQNAPGSGSVTGDGNRLTVTMTNEVRYISNALDKHGEEVAIDHRKKMVESVIKRMMGRKTKSASRSLK